MPMPFHKIAFVFSLFSSRTKGALLSERVKARVSQANVRLMNGDQNTHREEKVEQARVPV